MHAIATHKVSLVVVLIVLQAVIAIREAPNAECVAVASRTLENAQVGPLQAFKFLCRHPTFA